MQPQTLAIHSARMIDRNVGAVVPPIYLSTTFEREIDGGFPEGFSYARANNPNREVLEKALALLEGGHSAVAFSSGQAATMTLLQALRPGDHILLARDGFHGTVGLLEELFRPWGLTYSRVDMRQAEDIQASIRANTRLLWIETPSNPQLKIIDIQLAVKIAHEVGAICVCDNTWATPVLQHPLQLGCDVVMHSMTKYFGGHSDVISGALIFREDGELAQRVRKYQALGGAIPSPFDCWLILRGIKSMHARVRMQSDSAEQVARFLATQSEVEVVHYPGLETHLGHDIAQKQMEAFGGMLSFQVKGGEKEAMRVAGQLQLITRATSLGGVESLIEHRASVEGPATTTPPNLLRLSVGLEHPDDLIADLRQALANQPDKIS